jgi:putative ABC transport system permease protein
MVCLASSIVLIFSAISFNFSKDEILIEVFKDRTHYDCEIFLKDDADEEFINRLTASVPVQNLEKVYYYTRDIEANGVKEEKLIKAISPGSKLISIYDKKKNPLSVSDDEIVLERHTAEPRGVSAGDTVYIDGIPTKISAISDEHEKRTQYISSNSIEALGEPDMYSIICNIDKEHQTALMDYLFKEDNFIYTAFTSNIYNALKDAFKAFTVAVMIILSFATIIGMMIVINTVSFNLQEQKKDICLLRTLGFQQSELSIRLLTQTAIYYVFSCIIGIPGGILVTKLILNKLETEVRNYPLVNDYRVYLFTLLLVFAYILACHFISMRSIKKWDLVETVKDKE